MIWNSSWQDLWEKDGLFSLTSSPPCKTIWIAIWKMLRDFKKQHQFVDVFKKPYITYNLLIVTLLLSLGNFFILEFHLGPSNSEHHINTGWSFTS